ncbi:type II toxin-antitoxin system PemK/MazF family toxin [Candidatus Micrarchaeota archaeon]|nr:type II toxin-antitoxin system PemK/MazF family toxin [Candidatus Micrarchaeota archaeon]
MNFRKKEIYLGLVDFADKPKAKDRPVVIVSSNKYNETHSDVIVCSMTTNSTHDCFVALDQNCLERGDFYPGSGIRYDCIQLMSKERLHMNVGKVTDGFQKKLFDKIFELVR